MARSGHYKGTDRRIAKACGLAIDYGYQPTTATPNTELVPCPTCHRPTERRFLGAMTGRCPACRNGAAR